MCDISPAHSTALSLSWLRSIVPSLREGPDDIATVPALQRKKLSFRGSGDISQFILQKQQSWGPNPACLPKSYAFPKMKLLLHTYHVSFILENAENKHRDEQLVSFPILITPTTICVVFAQSIQAPLGWE